MRKESAIQSAILRYLRTIGYVYKISTTGIYDPKRQIFRKNLNKGIPDIYFMSNKHGAIWFEVKNEKGKGILREK